jgi:hypothetical protein
MEEPSHVPLRKILDEAAKERNELPPSTHNQEDVGDQFTLLIDKLAEMRMETAKHLLSLAENHFHKVELEVQQMRQDGKRKWEEYQTLMRMIKDAGSATAEIGRKISNGFKP